MLINGQKKYLSFAVHEMPRLFKDLRVEMGEISKKRKLETKPPISINCDKCDLVANNEKSLKVHKVRDHTLTISEPKKAKVKKEVEPSVRTHTPVNCSLCL